MRYFASRQSWLQIFKEKSLDQSQLPSHQVLGEKVLHLEEWLSLIKLDQQAMIIYLYFKTLLPTRESYFNAEKKTFLDCTKITEQHSAKL